MNRRMKTTALASLAAVLVLNAGGGLPAPAQQPPVGPGGLEDRARAVVAALAKGDYAAAGRDFDETMKKAAGPELLEKLWKGLVAQYGEFRSQAQALRKPLGKFQGVTVRCEFAKAPVGLRVVFNNQDQVSGLNLVNLAAYRPPDYVRPDRFRETDVQVGTGEDALPGKLTLPVGEGPFPAVVLVHGSGPQDRDETVGGHKPFRDLAGGLASRGVAVLRYDKRTLAHRDRMTKDVVARLTVKEEVLDDARAAVELLRRRPEVNPRRLFVLGHSLGAMAAPRLAQLEPTLAGIAVLASPARPLEDSLIDQSSYLLAEDKDMPEEGRKYLEKLLAQARRLKDKGLSDDDQPADLPLGVTASYLRSVDDLRPAATAAALTCPTFVLQGERDYQVTMTDFKAWEKALAGRKGARLKSYPGLNHLFAPGTGKCLPSEYEKEGHVAPEVIADLADWLTGASPSP